MRNGFKTILIADSDEEVRERLKTILADEGYKVETAKVGSEIIQKVQTHDIGVTIMDVFMPGMKVHKVIPAVKSINPGIPIIVMSADSSIDLAREVRKEGIFFYAMKPLNMEEIKLAVKDAVKKVNRETIYL